MIDALIMAGGRGARLEVTGEKPLMKIGGRFLVEYVIDALKGSNHIRRMFAATTENTKKTADFLKGRGIKIFRSRGKGYVEDMISALKEFNLGKTLVICADLPLISPQDIDWVIEEYEKKETPSLAVMVPLRVFKDNNLVPSMVIDGYVPSGINIVDGKDLNEDETKLITEKIEFAFNINTMEDVKMAERRMRHAH